MKLIDKDALVAEIERLKTIYNEDGNIHHIAKFNILVDILSFIDTLEVKEVDLETLIEDYINSHFSEGSDGGMISDSHKALGGVSYYDLTEFAKHFFELGIKTVQKGE